MNVSRRAGLTAAVTVVVLVVAVAAVAFVLSRNSESGKARATVGDYLADWSAGRYAEMATVAEQPVDSFSALYQASAEGLELSKAEYDLESVRTDSAPQATFRARITFRADYPEWTYTGTLPLVQRGDDWRIAWTPAALHPDLAAGQRLGLVPGESNDGRVLDRNGKPVADDTQLAQTVIGRLPSEPSGSPSGPQALRVRYDDVLGGRPDAAVAIVKDSGPATADAVVRRLAELPGEPGTDLTTTLDLNLQKAAESVVSGSGKAASVVLLDRRTGEIRAAAGNAAAGPRPSLTGRFPPGSTFKIVTLTAALQNGLTLDSPIDCPATVSVDGVTFKNAEDEAFGRINLRTAFAKSCNTAFVNIAQQLPDGAFAKAAEFYGCTALPGGADTPAVLPIPTFTCNTPSASGAAYVASAFGQAQVEASPLGMASIVAAASSGTWQPLRILPEGEGENASAEPSAEPSPAEPRSLSPDVTSALQEAMQAVVASGTATTISGSGVAGKTGTAEFGTETPPRAHAWFAGYKGDYAAAVFVEDGGFGGEVAAPIAARVLQSVPSS